ncbi:hypothetical protein GCM10017607_11730 [Microbacterium thalassium]|nr:hypothetical protein GCM10017607_11730 [Microbacterium thalassium]
MRVRRAGAGECRRRCGRWIDGLGRREVCRIVFAVAATGGVAPLFSHDRLKGGEARSPDLIQGPINVDSRTVRTSAEIGEFARVPGSSAAVGGSFALQ